MKKLLLLLGLAAVIAACKPCDDPTNPECPNYVDPCKDAFQTSADFQFGTNLPFEDTARFIPSDTVLGGEITFKATYPADTYWWKIGEDPREFSTPSVSLRFSTPENITVVLIVTRTPDTLCFPDDDGRDTVIRRVVMVPDIKQSSILGNYRFERVEAAAPGDSFDVQIFMAVSREYGYSFIRAKNLPEDCGNRPDSLLHDGWSPISDWSFNSVIIFPYSGYGCNNRIALAYLDPINRDSITLKYSYTHSIPVGTPPGHIFTTHGRRIKK